MGNLIKMDLYRMFKSLGYYILQCVQILVIMFLTIMMSSVIQPPEGYKMPIYETFGTGSLIVVCVTVAVYSCILSLSDFNSGYIKNYGGQVTSKIMIIVSKTVSIGVAVITLMIPALIETMVLKYLIYGYLGIDSVGQFVKYIAMEIFLLIGLGLICMFISMLIKKSTIAITICVILGMGMFENIFEESINEIMSEYIADFWLSKYTIIGNINFLGEPELSGGYLLAFVVGALAIICGFLLSTLVFNKRDVV